MTRPATAWFVLLATFVGGCATPRSCHEGTRLAAYCPGGELGGQPVPYSATYILHQPPVLPEGAAPGDGSVAHWTLRELHRGEWIGFGREENGQLVAIAGKEKLPLADGSYCWHVTPETEYSRGQWFLLRAGEAARDTAVAVLRFPVELAGGILLIGFSAPGANWGP